jgi:PAS domain-containing protein
MDMPIRELLSAEGLFTEPLVLLSADGRIDTANQPFANELGLSPEGLAGGITFLNAVAEHLTGWSSQAARGRPLREVFRIVNESTRQPADDPVARVLETG